MTRGEASCICDFIVEITMLSNIRQKQIWASYIHLRLMKKPYKSVCRQTSSMTSVLMLVGIAYVVEGRKTGCFEVTTVPDNRC